MLRRLFYIAAGAMVLAWALIQALTPLAHAYFATILKR